MAVAHNPAHNTLPQATQRKVSLYFPPYPPPPPPATSPRPDGVRVPDFFNYSPGEDDSRWQGSLESEEEEKLKRRISGKSCG